MKLARWLANTRKLLWLLTSPKTYTQLSNWPVYLADYLGLTRGEYTLKLRHNLKLTLKANSPQKYPVYEVILRDDYRLLPLRYHPLRTIIDLGANIGVFSLYAHRLFPEAKIYAFEPDPQSFKLLRKNIADNDGQNIFPFNLACYSRRVVQRLKHGKTLRPKDLRAPKWFYPYKRSLSLAEILSRSALRTCDLLKLDVEGAEYDILYSLSESELRRIKRIHLEYHNLNPKTDLNGASLSRFLQNHHFQVIQKEIRFQNIGMLYATHNI